MNMDLETFAAQVQALRPGMYTSVSIERDTYQGGRVELTYVSYADGMTASAKTPEDSVALLAKKLAARAERVSAAA